MPTSEPTGRELVPGFAAMITAAREMKGWSIAELARQAELSVNTVSSIERETRAPSLGAASLVTALGLRAWLHEPATPIAAPAQPSVPPPNLPALVGQKTAAKRNGKGKAGGER